MNENEKREIVDRVLRAAPFMNLCEDCVRETLRLLTDLLLEESDA
jgi:hypothetical protein